MIYEDKVIFLGHFSDQLFFSNSKIRYKIIKNIKKNTTPSVQLFISLKYHDLIFITPK